MAENIKKICNELEIEYIFKASFDKANRTKLKNFRGLNDIELSLDIFREIKTEIGIKVCTDIHETYQASLVGEIIDIIQIPAFLCRQTDLLISAAKQAKL